MTISFSEPGGSPARDRAWARAEHPTWAYRVWYRELGPIGMFRRLYGKFRRDIPIGSKNSLTCRTDCTTRGLAAGIRRYKQGCVYRIAASVAPPYTRHAAMSVSPRGSERSELRDSQRDAKGVVTNIGTGAKENCCCHMQEDNSVQMPRALAAALVAVAVIGTVGLSVVAATAVRNEESDMIAKLSAETLNCEGYWSTCTAECETSNERVWMQTQAPSAFGTACPSENFVGVERADCRPGDGSCADGTATAGPVPAPPSSAASAATGECSSRIDEEQDDTSAFEPCLTGTNIDDTCIGSCRQGFYASRWGGQATFTCTRIQGRQMWTQAGISPWWDSSLECIRCATLDNCALSTCSSAADAQCQQCEAGYYLFRRDDEPSRCLSTAVTLQAAGFEPTASGVFDLVFVDGLPTDLGSSGLLSVPSTASLTMRHASELDIDVVVEGSLSLHACTGTVASLEVRAGGSVSIVNDAPASDGVQVMDLQTNSPAAIRFQRVIFSFGVFNAAISSSFLSAFTIVDAYVESYGSIQSGAVAASLELQASCAIDCDFSTTLVTSGNSLAITGLDGFPVVVAPSVENGGSLALQRVSIDTVTAFQATMSEPPRGPLTTWTMPASTGTYTVSNVIVRRAGDGFPAGEPSQPECQREEGTLTTVTQTCFPDMCFEVDCMDHGSCVDGACECVGYTGAHCQLECCSTWRLAPETNSWCHQWGRDNSGVYPTDVPSWRADAIVADRVCGGCRTEGSGGNCRRY